MIAHTLGFPRIGLGRELKKAQEAFWKGRIGERELLDTARALRMRHWTLQNEAGIDLLPVGDFSLYDTMLDTTAMLGAVPGRFGWDGGDVDVETLFGMARGDGTAAAMEMTKWFDTNYHYIVPEFDSGQTFKLSSAALLEQLREASDAGFSTKVVVPGPLTYIHLGKETEDGFDRWDHLDAVVSVYEELLHAVAAETAWIQLDEPILVLDLPMAVRERFLPVYERLRAAAGAAKLMVATYFGDLRDNAETAASLPVDALHVDLVRGTGMAESLPAKLPSSTALSVGIVDGRNIWRVDAGAALAQIRSVQDKLGPDRVMLGTSCSLLHCPIDVDEERGLGAEIRAWMAFAKQKCAELRMLADSAGGDGASEALRENREAQRSRRESALVRNARVRERVAAVADGTLSRPSPHAVRKRKQQAVLDLPVLPTTTIGSFPQTSDIRSTRRDFKNGMIDEAAYETAMRGFIRDCVEKQEDLGLNVLVHGEPERNDMVEYFGEQLDGVVFTRNGWVQSYGSRCVKPPIIVGDVSRPKPMTVKWTQYAQSLTDKPMKAMLTGPVTLLAWSFVRDDQPREETCRQIAVAIRDEVVDLERAGTSVIQIDEAALREKMPLRREDWDAYLRWAVDAFRLTTAGLADRTQVHTHMCYSEFNEIVEWIARMDADVISIEASRSGMELLQAFRRFDYPNDIGPGVYDIHSPRVPSIAEMAELLRLALEVVPADRLWVNPDCGLKTRAWPETLESLRHLVEAGRIVRSEVAS